MSEKEDFRDPYRLKTAELTLDRPDKKHASVKRWFPDSDLDSVNEKWLYFTDRFMRILRPLDARIKRQWITVYFLLQFFQTRSESIFCPRFLL